MGKGLYKYKCNNSFSMYFVILVKSNFKLDEIIVVEKFNKVE